jgi:hypothetical protein
LALALPADGYVVWVKTLARLHRLVSRLFGGGVGEGHASPCPGGAPLRLALPAFFSRIDAAPPASANDEYWHAHVDTLQYGSFDVTTLLYLSDEQEAIATDAEFSDFLAGMTRAEYDAMIAKRRSEAARVAPGGRKYSSDILETAGAPDAELEERIRAAAEVNFRGGAFEFLGAAAAAASAGASGKVVCAIGDNASAADCGGGERSDAPVDCERLVVHPRRGRVLVFSSGPEHPHRVDKIRQGTRWTSTNAFTCDQHGRSVNLETGAGSVAFPPPWLADIVATAADLS